MSLDNSASHTVLQERIDHLETLVRSLAGKQQGQSVTSATGNGPGVAATAAITETGDRLVSEFGHIDLQGHESSYVESDHWMSILDEISDLKDMVKEPSDANAYERGTVPQRHSGTGLFLLSTRLVNKMEILATIPPRLVVDSIVAKYFKTADMPVTLINHRGVFLKQYEKFWDSPLDTPIMWITMLFGMMFIVSYCALFVDEGPDSLDEITSAEYRKIVAASRERMIQCLRLGNYLKGSPHTIEALLFLLQLEYIQGEDAQRSCWHLIGVIIRAALKMGYHRDGCHFSKMSVFDQEMRRRTWYLLAQFDIAASSQVGLPRLIKESQCDTAEPSNLLDDDFDDAVTLLPPARPPTEHTLSQFLVYKSRIVSVYGSICDFTTSSRQRDYNEVMRLDTLLNTEYSQKPPILDLKPMHRSFVDGAHLVTRRLYIAMTFYHARITLHRKFMIDAKLNMKYAFSHSTCIDAALSALQLQVELFEHCQPGGKLCGHRWKIISLIQSEFLLATTVLCYNLNDDYANSRWQYSPLVSDALQQKIVVALQTSENVWQHQQELSKEARTAVKAIRFVLKRVYVSQKVEKAYIDNTPQSNSSPAPKTDSTNVGAGSQFESTFFVSSDLEPSKTDTPSMFGFTPLVSPYNKPTSISSDTLQADVGDASFDSLLDMDWSWDTWLQFE